MVSDRGICLAKVVGLLLGMLLTNAQEINYSQEQWEGLLLVFVALEI